MKLLLSILITTTHSQHCNQFLLQSYNLQGLKSPQKSKNLFCPKITNNCCTKPDLLKIFDQVNSTLKPSLQSYQTKMKTLFHLLSTLHQKVQKLKHKPSQEQLRKEHCEKKYNEFKQINFTEIYQNLKIGFQKSIIKFNNIHNSFYCVLCDGNSHKLISKEKNKDGDIVYKIKFDVTTCDYLLESQREYYKALNVDLVNYFKSLQQHLDCSYYQRHYSFPFLFEKEFSFSEQNCLSQEDNYNSRNCMKLCETFNIAGISNNLEGNVIFISKAIDYYSNLVYKIQQQQSGGKKQVFNPLLQLDEINRREQKERGLQIKFEQKSRKLRKNLIYDEDLFVPKISYKKIRQLKKRRQLSVKNNKNKKYQLEYDNFIPQYNLTSKEIYKRTIDPIDLTQSVSVFEGGIDLLNYLKDMNFECKKAELLKDIKGEDNCTLDTETQILLSQTDSQSINIILSELKKVYDFKIPDLLKSSRNKSLIAIADAVREKDELFTAPKENTKNN